MNAADRKLITEFLSAVAEYGTLPWGLTAQDSAKRREIMAERIITIAGDAAFVAKAPREAMTGDESALLHHRLESATRHMREVLASPLPYTPEPPEYLVVCECGLERTFHIGPDRMGPTGVVDQAGNDRCQGFTPASTTTTEGQKAS